MDFGNNSSIRNSGRTEIECGDVMNKFTAAFKSYPLPMIVFFLAGVVFAHFGWHIATYNYSVDLLAAIDERINPEQTVWQKINPFD